MSADISAGPGLELSSEQVRRTCDPESFDFQTTSELTGGTALVGQERAASALAFGLTMTNHGFNVFASGAPGTGKTTAVRTFLQDAARSRPTPDDWCYVHNFHDPTRPRSLRLPPGQGRRLRDELARLVQTVRRELPRVFEGDEYIAQREEIVKDLSNRRDEGLHQLGARAHELNFTVRATPTGFMLIPVHGEQPLSEDDLGRLSPEERQSIAGDRDLLMAQTSAFFKEMRAAERETMQRLEDQDREVALHAVGGLVDDLIDDFAGQPDVAAFLHDIQEGILADVVLFREHPLTTNGTPTAQPGPDNLEHALHERAFRKYQVNVVVDNADTVGAPVIVDANTTYPNLVGRIEREALFGALLTDFTLIRAGALHRANGGFLVMRIEDLFRAPMAWQGLTRALREKAVVIEDLGEALGFAGTRSLQPDPIPLDLKVVLLGQPLHYYLLHALDPDFQELFKVRADFDTQMDRTPSGELAYVASIAAGVTQDGLPLDCAAVARLIEESSRLAADQQKLSIRFGQVADIVREADYWATQAGASAIGAEHIRKAVEQRRYRSSLVQDRLREMTARGVLLIRPDGAAVGQVHGLAVIQAGDVAFGRPCRITATVAAGREGLLDIERETELGGPIHSKGVLILGGYLADTYVQDKPLALSARLVFEQSYEQVEGDSASLAELLALLSRLANVPLSQAIAVTGSVNQRGEVQAIGGVNEKIEGFYDACLASGLTGAQGVVVPYANVENLMLRDDVVAAVAAGQFHVYAVRTVDEALERLTGRSAGPRQADGSFPPDGIHALVDRRMHALAVVLRDFAAQTDDGPSVEARPSNGKVVVPAHASRRA
ncbi:MAG: AAA family ATPase [Chloroflexota bacterium]